MEAMFVRFSRPLLIRMGRYKEDYYYQTVYGFLVPENYKEHPDLTKLDQYCGYLCALHCWGDGDNDFTVSYERRGVPDWVDNKGVVHIKQDRFMDRIEKKCMKKLGFSYELISMDVYEDELFNRYLNRDLLIIDEDLYWELEPNDEEGVEDDGLPF